MDSAYCPRSFASYDAATASSGVDQKDAAGLKDCPVCFGPVSVSIDADSSDPDTTRLVCHYLCANCTWSSRECSVVVPADGLLALTSSRELDSPEEKALTKQRDVLIAEAARELEICCRRRIAERNQEGDAFFNSLTKMWAQRELEEGRRKRMQEATSTKGGIDEEKKREEKPSPPFGSCKEGSVPSMDHVKSGQSPLSPRQIAAQMSLCSVTPLSREDLFPLPVRYYARVSRRCRAEQAAGRTGILIKPKLNPLEGDSSLRAGHGQWWKKDSSAVHVVPRVQVCRYGVDPADRTCAVLLQVKNPTLNMIRLRLSRPIRPGGSNDEGVETFPLIHPRELEHILVMDAEFTETHVKARLSSPEVTSSLAPTDFFVLDPANDPYLDLGKGQEEDPTKVKHWDAASALDAPTKINTSRMHLVATQGDTAWVELILRRATDGKGASDIEHDLFAVPLTLQIEVGNGSWEASLIKHRDLPEEEKDLVSINLVMLLR